MTNLHVVSNSRQGSNGWRASFVLVKMGHPNSGGPELHPASHPPLVCRDSPASRLGFVKDPPLAGIPNV